METEETPVDACRADKRAHTWRRLWALFPISLCFRAAGSVCPRSEQLGNSGKSFVKQSQGAAQYRVETWNSLLPVPPPATSEIAKTVPTLQIGSPERWEPLPSQHQRSDRPGFTFRSVCLLIVWFLHQSVGRNGYIYIYIWSGSLRHSGRDEKYMSVEVRHLERVKENLLRATSAY